MKVRLKPSFELDFTELQAGDVEHVIQRFRASLEQLEAELYTATERHLKRVFPGAVLTLEMPGEEAS